MAACGLAFPAHGAMPECDAPLPKSVRSEIKGSIVRAVSEHIARIASGPCAWRCRDSCVALSGSYAPPVHRSRLLIEPPRGVSRANFRQVLPALARACGATKIYAHAEVPTSQQSRTPHASHAVPSVPACLPSLLFAVPSATGAAERRVPADPLLPPAMPPPLPPPLPLLLLQLCCRSRCSCSSCRLRC